MPPFLKALCVCVWSRPSASSTLMNSLPSCFPRAASRQPLPPGWFWSWCCNMWKGFRIARPLTPCAAASKYALGLKLTDPGFDHTVLSEFQARLVTKDADRLLLDTLLDRLRKLRLRRRRGGVQWGKQHHLHLQRGDQHNRGRRGVFWRDKWRNHFE